MTCLNQTQNRRRYAAISGVCATLILGGTLVPAQARSLAEIKKSKELRACVVPTLSDATVEPANCREKCKFSGLVPEEVAVLTKALGHGIKSKLIRVEWDEQFFNKEGKTVREASYTPELLASGKCDLYPNTVTTNEWRLKKLDIVVLSANRMMVVASKAMKGQLKTPTDLAGKTTATSKDTSWHTWLQEQNQSTYSANPIKIELMDLQERFTAVDAGKVDFTLASGHEAIWNTRHTLKNAAVAFPVSTPYEFGWAFRKEDKDLQAAVQAFFEDQRGRSTSELNSIWRKHYGSSLTEFIALMISIK